MWDGPRQGPRGGPPFRGDHRGEMFGGRDHPMPDYRGRDGMNMGPMGHMGPRPLDLPPMDMRMMDGPPMRGRDMDPRDMRGREPNREFFRPGDEPDFNLRRHYENNIREKLMNSSGFPGPGRNSADMGGRGMPPQEPNSRFMDNRDRESFRYDMPRFSNPNLDGRRGFPMERNDAFRDMHDRPAMGINDSNRYEMDLPPRFNNPNFDRRGGPPLNPRGGFNSDMDFRNRPGPSVEFRGRDRSPVRFGNNDGPPVDRARPDRPSDVPQRPEFMGGGENVAKREYPDSCDSPLTDYRSGEEMTLAEEWKNRQKDKNPFGNMGKGMGGVREPNFPVGFGRDVNIRDLPQFQERDKSSVEFPGKDVSFPQGNRFPAAGLPSAGGKGPQDHPLPEISPLTGPVDRENEGKHWLGERGPKHFQNKSNRDERPPYHQAKNQLPCDIQEPNDCFKGIKDIPQNEGPARDKLGSDSDFQGSSTVQARDQDYRDIDYRTGSGRVFDYKHEDLPAAEKLLKESKPITTSTSKFSESGSQDQDYRNASVEDKVSNILSISGIPKTASVDQILGAFAVRDGVPVQGMKIKNVVPGYSYDTAYVEFLNLEDAVHFMESNKGYLKIGTRAVSIKYIQPDECDRRVHESDHKVPQLQEPQLPRSDESLDESKNGSKPKSPVEPLSRGQWQRSSDLTPEAWQQQVDQQLAQQEAEQQAESWSNHNLPHNNSHQSESVFRDSKTMIIKNVKTTTTVETILKALDPFAYLDERNVRLVKGRPPGTKCFCFVDMDSHEQVTRLVELLTKPRPLYVDGVRVYAEVAKPLKNQNFRRDADKSNAPNLGYPPDVSMMPPQQQFPHPPPFLPPLQPPPIGMHVSPGELMPGCPNPALSADPNISQGIGYVDPPAVDPMYQAGGPHVPTETAGMAATTEGSQAFLYGPENPDVTNYLYDATSGFYYDPETTLYYDPNSRYFYNAQTQDYLYWDAVSKTYIPVPGGNSADTQPMAMTAEDQAILSNPAADAPLEMRKPSGPPQSSTAAAAGSTLEAVSTSAPDKKEDDDSTKKDKEKESKDEKPRSLAAVKIMKDMERWAKIQNRQKESVRAPSPVLKSGMDDERRQSKSADAGFAVFERKITVGDDLFKKPLAPLKKDEKSKRPMGSLGLLASDYAAGSDEEVEEDKDEAARNSLSRQSDDRDDKLTDWKKMACLLCRRQFPNKDALIRHQQLSDLHKQNMEIHLKIKRSKKELEALENQEKELNARETPKSPEQKRRKHHHQQPQHHHNSWAGSSGAAKASERPGLGAEPVPRKKKEPVVWDHATYKQAVRKAMFARFKELE
ncbi:RNA-binding protein 6 isoform X2 [Parambassis ranga]|nr:RNA-binding protein 6-like isoform X2 [Parambassis ranga]